MIIFKAPFLSSQPNAQNSYFYHRTKYQVRSLKHLNTKGQTIALGECYCLVKQKKKSISAGFDPASCEYRTDSKRKPCQLQLGFFKHLYKVFFLSGNNYDIQAAIRLQISSQVFVALFILCYVQCHFHRWLERFVFN